MTFVVIRICPKYGLIKEVIYCTAVKFLKLDFFITVAIYLAKSYCGHEYDQYLNHIQFTAHHTTEAVSVNQC